MENNQAIASNQNIKEAINDIIIDAIQDIKGKNIIKLDLRQLGDAPTDYFIICEGESTTQIRAISENISKKVREHAGARPSHREGVQGAKWILIDYFDTSLKDPNDFEADGVMLCLQNIRIYR